jgi:hypothetical protein
MSSPLRNSPLSRRVTQKELVAACNRLRGHEPRTCQRGTTLGRKDKNTGPCILLFLHENSSRWLGGTFQRVSRLSFPQCRVHCRPTPSTSATCVIHASVKRATLQSGGITFLIERTECERSVLKRGEGIALKNHPP